MRLGVVWAITRGAGPLEMLRILQDSSSRATSYLQRFTVSVSVLSTKPIDPHRGRGPSLTCAPGSLLLSPCTGPPHASLSASEDPLPSRLTSRVHSALGDVLFPALCARQTLPPNPLRIGCLDVGRVSSCPWPGALRHQPLVPPTPGSVPHPGAHGGLQLLLRGLLKGLSP